MDAISTTSTTSDARRPFVPVNSSNEDMDEKALLYHQVERECIAMMNHAFSSGMMVPPGLVGEFEQLGPQNFEKDTRKRCERLASIHNRLSRLVKPAKPSTLLLIEDEMNKGGYWVFLGRIPLIRRMMATALLSLLCLIMCSLTAYINEESMKTNLFNSEGIELLVTFIFLLSAAGLGASFSGLFKANEYVLKGTYEPKYETSYWVRLVVGLISGILMTQLIPFEENGYGMTAANIGKPTIALLCGFSANLVYSILNRLVETVQSMVVPKAPVDPEEMERTIFAQLEAKNNVRNLKIANGLAAIRKEMAAGKLVGEEAINKAFEEHLDLSLGGMD